MATVLWAVKAKNRLYNALARQFCRAVCPPEDQVPANPQTALDMLLRKPTAVLANTFAKAETIVVQDHLKGFRAREDLFVLLVEVFAGTGAGRSFDDAYPDPGESSTYIVKIGPEDKVRPELENWKLCRPLGMHHDPVFLPVHEGCVLDGLMSIVYGDAHQLVGVGHVATLEEAVLRSVRFGVPSVQSVGLVLIELLERLGHMMYGRSFVDDPAQRKDYRFYVGHMDESLTLWEQDPRLAMVRRAASMAESGPELFIDPVDYFSRYLKAHVEWARPSAAEVGGYTRPCPGTLCWSRDLAGSNASEVDEPGPAQLIPRMLRGASHGDLHGRNVLVGIVRERVLWPALFDYEDMSFCNLIAWDFAKLETELKTRAYVEIFAGAREPTAAEHDAILENAAVEKYENQAFLTAVQQSELRLNELTEMCYRLGHWPPVTRKADALQRLHSIVLELRRMAQVHLGIDRGRPNEWLEEYYFVLACYGVSTSRFSNLTLRQWLAAYLSAGVASARLSWPRRQYRKDRERLGL